MFARVARMETVHIAMAIATQHKWKVCQMDVKSTFLNGVLKEEVYVAQPPVYEGVMISSSLISKKVMKNEFEMTDLGLLRYFLGIEVKQIENGIFISQEKYVANILERFNMQNNKIAPTPTIVGLKSSKEDCNSNVNSTLDKSMIGILMYLTATRLDIMYAMSLVSRFMETPKETHWKAAKRIVRYANGTKLYGILYAAADDFRLVGYTDSDWPGSVVDRKRTSGYVFHLGSGAVSWASKKQPIVSLSTTEFEYVVATTTMCQEVWMRRMLRYLCHDQEGTTTIFCDNTLAIEFSKNYVFHKRTKDIDAKYHFIRELINNDEIVLHHYRSQV
eukprot:PITA_36168